MASNYCSKCIEEIGDDLRNNKLPEDVLDENRECVLCGELKVCPVCSRDQDERFGEFPLLVCMDCITEADNYLQHINEVSADINSTLRLLEAEGWNPMTLVFDATMHDRGVVETPLSKGMRITLDPVPMVFAVAVNSERELGGDKQVKLDPVNLCPSAIRRLYLQELRDAARSTGARITDSNRRSKGQA